MTNAEIRALSLIAVRDAIARGYLTAQQVVAAAIEQADRFKDEYALFITYTPERAMTQAITADQARAAGSLIGPLHGVPLTNKDNIDQAGLVASSGSRVLAERVAAADATVVAKLKAAGAIFLGQTNMHEMAAGGTSTNVHYGAVRNPWDPTRIPGGSSGGAAAALSLQIGHAALGTDAGGSVRGPAAYCGLVGLKQTHGVVSLNGIVAASNWTVDHIGPLTRTVADARLMLSLMQGHDLADPESATRMPEPFGTLDSLKGLKVGLPETFFWEDLDADIEAVCRNAVGIMADAGAEIVPVKLETITLLTSTMRAVSSVDAYVVQEQWLQEHPDWYGEELRYRLLAAQYVLAQDYVRGLRVRRLWVEECSRVLDTVDVLVMPTRNTPPHVINDPAATQLPSSTMPFNQSGHPAISIPAGLTRDGLPVGFQIVAQAFADYKLLAVAEFMEQQLAFDPTPPVLKAAAVGA